VDFHAVLTHVKSNIGHVQKVIRKVLLDDVALVATADDKVIDAVVGVRFEDMPKDWLATDLDHRLGSGRGFFRDPSAKSSGKNDSFHQ
jgi:hypothetical protein